MKLHEHDAITNKSTEQSYDSSEYNKKVLSLPLSPSLRQISKGAPWAILEGPDQCSVIFICKSSTDLRVNIYDIFPIYFNSIVMKIYIYIYFTFQLQMYKFNCYARGSKKREIYSYPDAFSYYVTVASWQFSYNQWQISLLAIMCGYIKMYYGTFKMQYLLFVG